MEDASQSIFAQLATAANMRSDWRDDVVDLTLDDPESGDDTPDTLAPAASQSRPAVPLPGSGNRISSTPVAQSASTHVPLPIPNSASQTTPLNVPALARRTQNNPIAPTNSNGYSSTHNVASNGSNSATRQSYVPIPLGAHNGTDEAGDKSRAEKRRKLSQPGWSAQAAQAPQAPMNVVNGAASTTTKFSRHKDVGSQSVRGSGSAAHAQPGPAPSRLASMSAMLNKAPSVQQMNAALKANGTSIPLVEQIAESRPRPLQIGRMPSGGDRMISRSPSLPTRAATSTTPTGQVPYTHGNKEWKQYNPLEAGSTSEGVRTSHTIPQAEKLRPSPTQIAVQDQATVTREQQPARLPLFSEAESAPKNDDNDSVMSNTSSPPARAQAAQLRREEQDHQLPPSIPLARPTARSAASFRSPISFTEEEEHLLIFLKEVKKFRWTMITSEFQKDYPGRPYTALQTRYSTKTNKRDRSQDPPALKLPPRWAAESVVDWASLHAENTGPRERVEVANLRRDASSATSIAANPAFARNTSEQDYSSGTDSGPRQRRPRRAPPVNYDVRRRNKRLGENIGENDFEDIFPIQAPDEDTPMRSESPLEAQGPAMLKARVVVNEPLEMHFDVDNARIGLLARNSKHGATSQQLPYLALSQRSVLQNSPEDWIWDQASSLAWQGAVLHVDYSPSELEQVQRAISKIRSVPKTSRHNTQRRHFRAILRDLPDPKLINLAQIIQSRLTTRGIDSIKAFLSDARAGDMTDTPQVLRLAAARPQKSHSSGQSQSTTTMLRTRETGLQSRRGWKTTAKALAYQSRNKITDTLGPLCSWTGASSDIHTVAWSPDGESFAAGAVAVTDVDSMQYNRHNNLLFGDLQSASIHELAEHRIERPRPETGANSTHAMFVSQDQELYTTITSVAFAPSGKIMYSAGYDGFIRVWHMEADSLQPTLGAVLRQKAEVELMIVNRQCNGMLATAAKTSGGSAIKLITIDEDDLSKFSRHSFRSEKAASRSDLRILPQALKFEPSFGGLILAGFGANVRADSGFDLTGDLCLWDIETQSQIPIYGSNRNVFDVTFNPNRRSMPLFAAGCVANGNVNRGTRSVIRLYDEKGPDRYTCPLEIECKALDMNDMIWCPEDERLIAAGCTDGRVYVWDMRRPDHPLRTLSHGSSLMPLQDGIHPERTDTGIRFLSWGDTATRLYSGSSDGVVKVWDVTRSNEDTFVKDLIALDSGIMAGAFTSDYSRLLLGEVNGSINVLDVSRDDCTIKDAEKLRYIPYACSYYDHDSNSDDIAVEDTTPKSGVAEGMQLLQSQQLQLAPMGALPIRQVVQGPNYSGPFDQSVDAPFLRQQALEFQLNTASEPGPQCDIVACKHNTILVTNEEVGDSGRSMDRIPDELRLQWTTLDETARIIPGKSRCTHCARPARPSTSTDEDAPVLCERCSFACFRCGAVNPIAPTTTTFICDTCAGVWEIGALGYECMEQPVMKGKLDVPLLRRYGRDMLEERMEKGTASFGDEMNALTDYYFSLAMDRPESPPL